MSYLTQMLALAVQNFLSAATGIAVVVRADPRLRARIRRQTIGNFWVDLTRVTLYILLPLSLVFALVLVSQGVIQNFAPYQDVHDARADRPSSSRRPVADGQPLEGRQGQRR